MYPYLVFRQLYNKTHIKQHYIEKVKRKSTAGLDKINSAKFEDCIKNNIGIINKKVLAGSYEFTNYKKLLISKGENKTPRVICIPTIRDKLVLSILNESLVKIFGDTVTISPLPHSTINHMVTVINSGIYDAFVKIDISKFYGSINHNILITKLKTKVHKKQILNLIQKAIETPSIEVPRKNITALDKRDKGVPEGLSISNALANIFLEDIDKKYKEISDINYFRYVDDIVILCSSTQLGYWSDMIKKDLIDLGLEINEKKDSGLLLVGFDYLGYKIGIPTISVRESSVLKIEDSIEKVFSYYKYSKVPNIRYLEWRINLRVTGCIINGKKYGWIFFFSQINDTYLLTHLDWLIQKIAMRYGVSDQIDCKKFKRTHYEVLFRLHNTKYIPNFDNYSIDQMRDILSRIYGRDLTGFNDKIIDIEFKKIIKKEVHELEKDIQFMS